MSLINAIGKKVITPAAKRAVKFAHITDPVQRKATQTFLAGGENLNKLAQELEPEMSAHVQKYFKQYERYGLSQGDLKYLVREQKDLLEGLEILSDEKMMSGILKRKHLIKDGLLGCVTKENKKAFAQVLNDKTITDEELGYIADLITNENVSVVRKLLKDKNFDSKVLQYLPSTHLTRENVEVLKAISKNGNVGLQEKLYLLSVTNKSNSDIAVKLLERANGNTEGFDSILHRVYAYEGMSEEGLKAFELRKKFTTELLDNPQFKLGTDKDGMENYLISKVISSVNSKNYELAQTALLKRNVNLYQLSDFLKDVTAENQTLAKRILNMASKDTILPDLSWVNYEATAKYLDEIEKINNPKAQNLYIEAMDGLKAQKLDEILNIIKTTKPANAKQASAVITCFNRGLDNTEYINNFVNVIEKSGRKLDNSTIANLTVLGSCDELPISKFIERIIRNKAIPDNELYFLTDKYISTAQKIKSRGFYLTDQIKNDLMLDKMSNDECIKTVVKLMAEYEQKQVSTVEKLPVVLEKLYENKNLTPSQIENIFSKIDAENIDIIEKYALCPEIGELDKLLCKTEVKEIESVFNSAILKYKGEILKARKDLPENQVNEILERMERDEASRERIMKIVNDKSIKDEYITELLCEKDFEMYQKNPQLALRALDLKIPLITKPERSMDIVPITDVIGEKRFAKMIKGVEEAKLKYDIAPTEGLSLHAFGGDADDLFYVLKQRDGLCYKFDKKSGKLLSIEKDGKVINVSKGTAIEDNVASEMKSGAPAPYRISSISEGKNGKIAETVYTESAIKGQYDIYHTRPDGSRIRIGHAQVTPNGAKHVKRTLKSVDGSKTYMAFREDKAGNSYMHSVIKDKTGKQLSEITRTFKVLSKNHFISTKNGQAYDIVFTNNNVVVTKLDSAGKKTAETVNYAIKDVPVDTADKIAGDLKNLPDNKTYQLAASVFKKYGIEPKTIDRSCVNMLKRLPGDEWFAMSKSCDFVMPQSFMPENACYAGNSIFMSKELNNNLGVFAHELGHAKFHKLDLIKDKELMKIYNEEKRRYTQMFPNSRIESIDYFLCGNQAGKRGLNETCAETNLMTDTIQTWDQLQDRTIFLEQYFPNTRAYLQKKFSQLS